MNQSNVERLISKLKIPIFTKPRKLRNINGPAGRMATIQKYLTKLFKHERIEVNFIKGNETRGYAERLISEAIRRGPEDKRMMDLACYWLNEKQLVHKLFKVLVPRYRNYTTAYTALYNRQRAYPGWATKRSILELKENPFPSITRGVNDGRFLLHNILLAEAKKAYYVEKGMQAADQNQPHADSK